MEPHLLTTITTTSVLINKLKSHFGLHPLFFEQVKGFLRNNMQVGEVFFFFRKQILEREQTDETRYSRFSFKRFVGSRGCERIDGLGISVSDVAKELIPSGDPGQDMIMGSRMVGERVIERRQDVEGDEDDYGMEVVFHVREGTQN